MSVSMYENTDRQIKWLRRYRYKLNAGLFICHINIYLIYFCPSLSLRSVFNFIVSIASVILQLFVEEAFS